MSTTSPEKEFQDGEMSGSSTKAPSALDDEKKVADVAGEDTDIESGEYATGLSLVLIGLGLGLGVFLVALDMVCSLQLSR